MENRTPRGALRSIGFITGEDGEKYAELLAVDPDGKGDIGNTHIRWRMKSPILQLLTPVVAEGLLYTVDSKALLSCLNAGRELNIVAENSLDGEIWATPAVTGGAILMRTSKYLYKIIHLKK